MIIVDCTLPRHGAAILDILNHEIVHGTALWEYEPRASGSMVGWFGARQERGFPVLGLETPGGELAGFATYGVFRAYAAFATTVEHSIYLRAPFRGQGHGSALLQALLQRARAQQLHRMVGCLDAGNLASIALHRKHGFELMGTLDEAGWKFGRWLDLAFYQHRLDRP
jgi:phosphinothricin acetyltransferase